jgi:hypothetical protein
MMQPKKKYILDVFGHEPSTLNELGDCVRAVIDNEMDKSGNRCVGLQWDIRYSDTVSNTHDAPMSGIINFGSRDGKPTSYPGWLGRVWVRYAIYPKSFGSDPFQRTLTYTGTGGFGSYSGPWERIAKTHYQRGMLKRQKLDYPEPAIFSWDYRIFADDWPVLMMWATLSNNENCTHRYHWVDLDVHKQDLEFINDQIYQSV